MKCSFCSKKNTEVKKIIASVNPKIGICDECVELAYKIVKEGPITIKINIKDLKIGEKV